METLEIIFVCDEYRFPEKMDLRDYKDLSQEKNGHWTYSKGSSLITSISVYEIEESEIPIDEDGELDFEDVYICEGRFFKRLPK